MYMNCTCMNGICFIHALFDKLALPNGSFKRHLRGQTSSRPAGHWLSLHRRNSAHLSRIKSMLRHAICLVPWSRGIHGSHDSHVQDMFKKRPGCALMLSEKKLIIAIPNEKSQANWSFNAASALILHWSEVESIDSHLTPARVLTFRVQKVVWRPAQVHLKLCRSFPTKLRMKPAMKLWNTLDAKLLRLDSI